MYFLLKELHREKVSGRDYYTNKGSYYTLCSCGAKTELKTPETGFSPDPPKVCPHCGAQYGNLSLAADLWSYKMCADLPEKELSTKEAMVSLARDGDIITLSREIINNKGFTTCGFAVESSNKVRFDIGRGLRIISIENNGVEVPITPSSVRNALSRVTLSQLSRDPEFKPFVDELNALADISNSSVLGIPCKLLVQYPVLDTAYHEAVKLEIRKYFGRAMAQAISDNVVTPGERSIKKAFGFPNSLLEPVLQLAIPAKKMWELVDQYGPDVAGNAVQIAVEVLGNISSTAGLAEFLASRTQAERIRLKTYLTEETTIYQGIESNKDAWNLLSDYINMCQKMEVPYQLCPKSLKLQHDLAARNYKLVLSEIEKADFVQAVSAPEYQKLAWTSRDGKWAVVVPAAPEDLVMEGKKQSHCVGSYIGYVNDGSKKICFLRRTEDLEKPVLTLTVNQRNVCTMYLGFDNRNATEEEYEVLQEWAKARKLEIEGKWVA